MRTRFLAGMAMALVCLPAATAAFSQETKRLKKQIPDIRIKDRQKLILKSDPSIRDIYAGECPCSQELSSVNAFLMKNMWVAVSNGLCPDDSTAQVSATLKVRFYNLKTGGWEEKNIPFTVDGSSRKDIKVVSGNVLVRKSTGITAEIINIQGPVQDCNPANNRKTLSSCAMKPID